MSKLPGTILIIEDDEDVLFTARAVLKKQFRQVIGETNPAKIPAILKKHEIDVVVLDMNFKSGETTGNEGLYWLDQILLIAPNVKVLMVTAYGDIQLAVESMKQGASDFLVKPWEKEKLVASVTSVFKLRATERKLNHYRSAQKVMHHSQPLIGNSRVMQETLKNIEKIAATQANILLLGENGTGKDLVAQLIHERSERSENPFIKVDLGAIQENLFESELFGHEKGAFTDAKESRPGRFEIASSGTLFLDEIGNLSPQLQSKLLTAIQNQTIQRLGSSKKIETDIRLISATNKPVHELVETNEFRQDLLYRINTVEVTIPPLRDRKEDIPGLAFHFLDQFKNKYNKPNLKLSEQTLSLLKKHTWPGNVRELQHAVERAVIMSENQTIAPEHFSLKPTKKSRNTEELNVESIEREAITEAINACQGNMSLASKKLGLSRSTLYRKLKKYDI